MIESTNDTYCAYSGSGTTCTTGSVCTALLITNGCNSQTGNNHKICVDGASGNCADPANAAAGCVLVTNPTS